MREHGLQGSRIPNKALRFRNAKAVVCWVALGAAGCGGQAHGKDKSELLLVDELGQPAAQTQVLVDGKVVTTNDEGRAELGELPASYDAAVAAGTNVFAFMGLRSRSPTIEIANSSLDILNEHAARINISVNPAINQDVAYFAGVTGDNISRQTVNREMDAQSNTATVKWAGPGDATLSAQAILMDVDLKGGYVLGYSGFASQSWPNAAQRATVDWTPEFEAPPFETATIHVDVSLPPDTDVGWYTVTLRQASGETGLIGRFRAGTGADAGTDLVVPALPGATFDISAALFGPIGTSQVVMRAVSAGASVHAESVDSLQQLAPENGQENVTPRTDFSWSAQPGFIYELLAFSESSSQLNYQYLVATAGSTARLPDTSALGLPFPAGLTLQWRVEAKLVYASLDDYAAAPEAWPARGFSDDRTFKTKP